MNELKYNRGRRSLFCSKQSHAVHLQLFIPILYPHFHHIRSAQLTNKWITNTSDQFLCLCAVTWCLTWYYPLPVSLVLICVHLVTLFTLLLQRLIPLKLSKVRYKQDCSFHCLPLIATKSCSFNTPDKPQYYWKGLLSQDLVVQKEHVRILLPYSWFCPTLTWKVRG